MSAEDKLSASRPSRSWCEKDGVIYFSVESDGTSGIDWVKRLEGKGFYVENYAKQVLCSPSFKPTNGVMTEVAVLKGMLFTDNNRTTENVRTEGTLRKLGVPSAELACLIREKFTDKEIEAMGLWYIISMHEYKYVKNPDCGSIFLSAHNVGDGRFIAAYSGRPASKWRRVFGFAFAVLPQ